MEKSHEYDRSHPAGVRVLKQAKVLETKAAFESHPAGVRVLKLAVTVYTAAAAAVAPRRGACVETLMHHARNRLMTCRTPQGCVC